MKKWIILFLLPALLFGITSCSVSRTYNEGFFTYSIHDGQATLTKYTGGFALVTIPAEFRGFPVTKIEDGVFDKNVRLRELIIEGNNLKEIGKRAFAETSIKKLVFPDSLQKIGDEAFSECDILSKVDFAGENIEIGNAAFYRCFSLEQVLSPNGLKTIGNKAFFKCEYLTEIDLSTTEKIGDFAFGGCYALSGDIELSATSIGERAFIACKNILSIKAVNTHTVGAYAFSDCESLHSIELSDKLTIIPDSCFEGCENLETVVSGDIEKVGKFAFHQCLKLQQLPTSDTIEIYKSSIKNSGLTGYDCIDDDDVLRVIDGEEYTRTFYDEFDGPELDLTKWNRCPEWKRRGAYWRDENSYVDGHGNLVLNITSGKDPEGGNRNVFFSGAIEARQDYNQKYGYYEIRCNLTDFPGFWSAFWLMPCNDGMNGTNVDGTGNDGAEIDIYESPFSYEQQVNYAVHWDGYGQDHKSIGNVAFMDGLYLGYHTFALKWTDQEYVFYIDSEEYWRITDPALISHVEEWMQVTVEVGDWGGEIYEEDVPLVGLLTDYVKVYAVNK